MTEIFSAYATDKMQGHAIDPNCHTIIARIRSGVDAIELGLNDGVDTMILSPTDTCPTYIGPSNVPFVRISYKKATHQATAKTRLDLVFLR